MAATGFPARRPSQAPQPCASPSQKGDWPVLARAVVIPVRNGAPIRIPGWARVWAAQTGSARLGFPPCPHFFVPAPVGREISFSRTWRILVQLGAEQGAQGPACSDRAHSHVPTCATAGCAWPLDGVRRAVAVVSAKSLVPHGRLGEVESEMARRGIFRVGRPAGLGSSSRIAWMAPEPASALLVL